MHENVCEAKRMPMALFSLLSRRVCLYLATLFRCIGKSEICFVDFGDKFVKILAIVFESFYSFFMNFNIEVFCIISIF